MIMCCRGKAWVLTFSLRGVLEMVKIRGGIQGQGRGEGNSGLGPNVVAIPINQNHQAFPFTYVGDTYHIHGQLGHNTSPQT